MLDGDDRHEQKQHANSDEDVGQVERWPVLRVDEVGDEAEPEPVNEVRDAAADQEPKRHRQERVASPGPREVRDHPHDCDHGEDRHCPGRVLEETERDPRVLHVVEIQRPDEVDSLAELQLSDDDRLGQLVGNDAGEADRSKGKPVRRRAASERLATETGALALVAEPTRTSAY